MINDMVDKKKWCPVIRCRNGPKFSTFLTSFFADDLIFISKATSSNARVIKRVIDDLCSTSGLNLNLGKSNVYFSKSGGASLKRNITNIQGFSQTPNLDKYLGIYLRHGRASREESGKLVDKVTAKFSGWKKKFLSTTGRTTLRQ